MTGWLPPRCPKGSFSIRAPAARQIIWCPRQIPNTGTFPKRARTCVNVSVTASGSPGPLERKTPSGAKARTSAAGVSQGTTVISQPTRASPSRMPRLMPQS